jgi:hypothetical protein
MGTKDLKGSMLDRLLNWAGAHETLLWWLGSASAAALVVTLVAVVITVVRMPADFFADRRHHHLALFRERPALALALTIARNTLGVVFLLAGLAMLVLPGQGLLTIFVALLLLDFPGKLRLERWLVAKPAVRRPLDWIRRKTGRPPLEIPRA